MASPLRVETERHTSADQIYLKVIGEIDIYTVATLKRAVNDLIASGQTDIVLDVSGVTFMDSSGFGILLSACRRVRPQGGRLALVRPNPVIGRMLRLTRLDSIIPTYDSVDSAMAAGGSNPKGEPAGSAGNR